MSATDTLTDRDMLFVGHDLTLGLEGGIAVMTIDQPGAPFNTVGKTLHAELAECVAAHALANPAILLIRNPKPHAADAKTGATPAIRAAS